MHWTTLLFGLAPTATALLLRRDSCTISPATCSHPTGSQYLPEPCFPTTKVCSPTNYYAAADQGGLQSSNGAFETQMKAKCSAACEKSPQCKSFTGVINKAADSKTATGTCFLFSVQQISPRSCADGPSAMIAYYKDNVCPATSETTTTTTMTTTTTSSTSTTIGTTSTSTTSSGSTSASTLTTSSTTTSTTSASTSATSSTTTTSASTSSTNTINTIFSTTTTATSACSSTSTYSAVPQITGTICYDLTYYRTSDQGQIMGSAAAGQVELQKRCRASCDTESKCKAVEGQLRMGSPTFGYGTCFFYNHDGLMARKCDDASTYALFGEKKALAVCTSSSSSSTSTITSTTPTSSSTSTSSTSTSSTSTSSASTTSTAAICTPTFGSSATEGDPNTPINCGAILNYATMNAAQGSGVGDAISTCVAQCSNTATCSAYLLRYENNVAICYTFTSKTSLTDADACPAGGGVSTRFYYGQAKSGCSNASTTTTSSISTTTSISTTSSSSTTTSTTSTTSTAPSCTSTQLAYVTAKGFSSQCIAPPGYIYVHATDPGSTYDAAVCANILRTTPAYQFYIRKLYNRDLSVQNIVVEKCFFYAGIPDAPDRATCTKDSTDGYSAGLGRNCAPPLGGGTSTTTTASTTTAPP